jgi:peptidyl-prolyl cis-trans isomerase A (cyclophilin A)
MRRILLLSAILIGGTMAAQAAKQQATIDTSKGTIVVELFPDKAPETIANFVGLANGTKEYTDPKTGQKKKSRFYDGLTFHRVIPDFMIQGGDPLGTGTGGPGYQFKDEIDPSLVFDKPGKLAMANAGPGTNGSQFFITVAATPWLNGHHTIFGQVIKGQDVADAISKMGDRNGTPSTPIKINKITIDTQK